MLMLSALAFESTAHPWYNIVRLLIMMKLVSINSISRGDAKAASTPLTKQLLGIASPPPVSSSSSSDVLLLHQTCACMPSCRKKLREILAQDS